jgi:hypothetical protein
VHVHIQRSLTSCTYTGTRNHVFRAMVVTPRRVAVAPLVSFQRRLGPIAEIEGRGYRGEAQDDPPSENGPTVNQAKAQVVSGRVVVRLLVTYNARSLRRVSQVPTVVTLARGVGTRLAHTR